MAAAICPSTYDWAKNSQGMDPCTVASTLIGVCRPGLAPLLPIDPKSSYPHPTSGSQNECTCSGPVYALVSACADCQGGTFDTWKRWSEPCEQPLQTFPNPPPVTIPPWASGFNIYMNEIFDPDSAKALAHYSSQSSTVQGPQSTSTTASTQVMSTGPSPSETSSTKTAASTSSWSVLHTNIPNIPSGNDTSSSTTLQGSTGILGINQPTDQASSVNLKKKKSSHKGAIAGGVVGSLIFLVALGALLFWWFRRRRKSRTAPSAAYIATYGTARPPTSNSFRPGLFAERAGSPLVSHAYSNSQSGNYRDDEKSTSTYSAVGPVQQPAHYSSITQENNPALSRES